MEKKLNLRPNQVPAKVLNSEPRKLNQGTFPHQFFFQEINSHFMIL